MLTSNKYTDYIVWCFLRFILYSFLLTFALYSYNDLPKCALEFKQDLIKSAKLSGIELPQYIKANSFFFKNTLCNNIIL